MAFDLKSEREKFNKWFRESYPEQDAMCDSSWVSFNLKDAAWHGWLARALPEGRKDVLDNR